MLLDTSGLLCCFDTSDARHARAQALFDGASQKIVHNYVLAEFVPLCLARGFPLPQILQYLRDLEAEPVVDVVWVSEVFHELAMQLLEARLDRTYSTCDAVSFVLMRGRGLNEAMTTDHHFEQEGFVRLLPGSQTP